MTAPDEIWAALHHDIDRIYQDLRATAAAFESSFAAHPDGYTLADMAALRTRIHATLAKFGDIAVGTGIVTAPDVVDDAPYWLEWWFRQRDGSPEALRVNLDPTGADFFDYTSEEWYDVPISSRSEHVAGPYVDYACTNQYTFTLSVPVHLGDRPIGVAAMDLPCDHIERRIMPALLAGPVPLAMVNANGRVIAAGRADPAPGERLVRRGRGAVDRSGALAGLCGVMGWELVALPRAARGVRVVTGR